MTNFILMDGCLVIAFTGGKESANCILATLEHFA